LPYRLAWNVAQRHVTFMDCEDPLLESLRSVGFQGITNPRIAWDERGKFWPVGTTPYWYGLFFRDMIIRNVTLKVYDDTELSKPNFRRTCIYYRPVIPANDYEYDEGIVNMLVEQYADKNIDFKAFAETFRDRNFNHGQSIIMTDPEKWNSVSSESTEMEKIDTMEKFLWSRYACGFSFYGKLERACCWETGVSFEGMTLFDDEFSTVAKDYDKRYDSRYYKTSVQPSGQAIGTYRRMQSVNGWWHTGLYLAMVDAGIECKFTFDLGLLINRGVLTEQL